MSAGTWEHAVNVLNTDAGPGDKKAALRTLERTWKQAEDSKKNELLPDIAACLLAACGDGVEVVRTRALELLRQSSSGVLVSDAATADAVSRIMPLLTTTLEVRLTQDALREPAEELRVELVALVLDVAPRCTSDAVSQYADRLVPVLIRGFDDDSDDVRSTALNATVVLVQACARRMAFHAEVLVDAMVPLLRHRKNGVRRSALKAVVACVKIGRADPILSPEKPLVAALGALTCDDNPGVRVDLVLALRDLGTCLSDRHAHMPVLLALLLPAAYDRDAIPDVMDAAWATLDAFGQMYEQDYEDQLRDADNWTSQDDQPLAASHLPLPSSLPRLGLRALARQHVKPVLGALLGALGDMAESRQRAGAAALRALLIIAQASVTSEVPTLLNGLSAALSNATSGGRHAGTLHDLEHAARLVGAVVPPTAVLPLLLPRLVAGCDADCTLLCCVLEGAPSSLWTSSQLVDLITATMDSEDVPQHRVELLFHTVVSRMPSSAEPQSQHRLLHTALLLSAIMVGTDVPAGAGGAEASSVVAGDDKYLSLLPDAQRLLSEYAEAMLQQLAEAPRWTRGGQSLAAFTALVLRCADAVAPHTDLVLRLVRDHTDKSKSEAEVRMSVFSVLARALPATPSLAASLSQHYDSLIREVVVPNASWSVGAVAAQTRLAAMRVLTSVLAAAPAWTDAEAVDLPQVVWPVLATNLDDHTSEARAAAVAAAQQLVPRLNWAGDRDGDLVRLVYPAVLARLDDACDDVRVAVQPMLRQLLLHAGMHAAQDIVHCLLVHLDDPSAQVRDAVEATLLAAARVHASVVRDEAGAVAEKHVHKLHCQRVLAACQRKAAC